MLKSATKLLLAHNKDINSTWIQMCDFLKKCNVNILETKDQRDKGIEHRLMKAWPGPFDSPDKIDKILFQALTEDMKNIS